jgi:preprotein translocase subunit YajC
MLLADAQPAPTGQQSPPPWTNFVPLILIFVVFYFVFLRPQQKRQKEQAEMLKALKAGDKVVSTGGIVGTIISVKDKTLSIRSADSKMEITKTAVAEILERSGEPSES